MQYCILSWLAQPIWDDDGSGARGRRRTSLFAGYVESLWGSSKGAEGKRGVRPKTGMRKPTDGPFAI